MLIRRLGSGWTGTVWLAEALADLDVANARLSAGTQVAAKIYDPAVFAIRGEIGRILHEFTTAQALHDDSV
jgi:hypothetical protein